MQIFIRRQDNPPDLTRIFIVHACFDPSGLSQEELATGELITVDTAPVIDTAQAVNTNVCLFYNSETNELWYEYHQRPLSEREKQRLDIDNLKSQLVEAQNAINLLLGV